MFDMFQFNFVGKLLGPKGNSLKRLQEDTITKMAILGRGSMRDRNKVIGLLSLIPCVCLSMLYSALDESSAIIRLICHEVACVKHIRRFNKHNIALVMCTLERRKTSTLDYLRE